jgi:hypothetical protein
VPSTAPRRRRGTNICACSLRRFRGISLVGPTVSCHFILYYFHFILFFSFSLRIDMDATLPGNNYRSAATACHVLCALSVLPSLSRPIVTRRHSKIVLLFNDEHNYNRWNSTLTAILSSDRLFSRGACCRHPPSLVTPKRICDRLFSCFCRLAVRCRRRSA